MTSKNTIEKTQLGKTGLTVSRICFGSAPIGNMPEVYGHDTSIEDAKATVRAIFNGPSNFMDTSRNYGAGRSEERIGMVIRERGGLPDGFVLGTKLDRDPETDRFSASAMRRSFEQSLAALGVDRVARVDTSEIDEPPHVLELRAHLRRAGLLADDDEEPAGCRFPARDDARAAIKRCRAQAERRGLRGPVTALARGHAIACFFAFQWVDMHSDLGPSAGTQGDQ